MSYSNTHSVVQQFPAVWYLQDFSLWYHLISGFPNIIFTGKNNPKAILYLDLYNIVIESLFACVKRHLHNCRTPRCWSSQVHSSWWHLVELHAAASCHLWILQWFKATVRPPHRCNIFIHFTNGHWQIRIGLITMQ